MALTPAQKEARKGKLTASAVGLLMEGNPDAVLNLYYEMVCDPRYTPPELDDVWLVQLGSHTELFSLHWYARRKGYGPLIKNARVTTDGRGCLIVEDIELYPENPVKRIGDLVVHPVHNWVAATLDGFDTALGMPIECKGCNNNRKIPDVIQKYMPQLHWQMFCTSTKKITLRVMVGAVEAYDTVVEWDDFYWSTLWARAQEFWHRVINKMPPGGTAVVAAPQAKAAVVPVYRTVDLTKPADMLPNWAFDMIAQLDVWLETTDAMKTNATATDKIKELLPVDVGHLIHSGAQIKRSKTGAVTISKDK